MEERDRHDDEGEREEDEYLLGTGAEELERLGFQHEVWARATHAAWERGGFAPGHTLLDLGSGPGYATLELAALVGHGGSVIAVDASRRFLGHLEREARHRNLVNIDIREGDIHELDLTDESVDGAWARWVLCYAADPAGVVAAVARSLRPGGSFVVLDYCNYEGFAVAGDDGAIRRVIEATDASFRVRGGDPDVGMRLPGLMEEAGLEVDSVRSVVRAARPGTALWAWPETFFLYYVRVLVDMDLLAEEEADAFRAAWADRSQDPSAFLLTPPMVEVIARRPSR